MDKKEIGRTVKLRRLNLQLTQQECADLAEVGLNTLLAIERGQGNPRLDTLLAVLDTLGLTLSAGTNH